MARKPNTVGGGSKTNFNGLKFEARADLRDAIVIHPVYDLRSDKVYENGKVVAKYYEKHSLYKEFLAPNGVDYKNYLSKKLLPDGALLVGKTVYIIEKKYQAGSGSVDEKLQTCDFKKKQYIKLFKPLNIKVEYYYVLNDWFRRPEYEDVFEYIESVGCKYFIEELPLEEVGL
jgi:hypothetical protein